MVSRRIEEIEVSSVYIAKDVATTMIHIARCHPIRRLTLRVCEIWPCVLEDILAACPNLEELSLHKVNRLNDQCIQSMIRRISSTLTSLSIHHTTTIDDDGLSTLFQNLHRFPHLTELRLDGSSFQKHDIDTLLHILSVQDGLPPVEVLSFKSCLISDDTVAQLVHAIIQSPQRLRTLKTLDLSINECSELGIHALGQLLSSPDCHLECLYLNSQRRSRPDRTSLSVKALSHALRINRSLKVLRLSGNEIRDTSLLESLEHNHGLECLDMCSNRIEEDGLVQLSHSLSFNRTLNSLNLKSNQFQSLTLLNLWKNDTLCHFDHSCRSTTAEAQTIAFLCRLNSAGRRLLRENPKMVGLWPYVIERCQQDVDVLYWFLRNIPILWGGRKTT